MGFFKCKHPFNKLGVYGPEKKENIDQDFDKITYRFVCYKCHEKISISYAKMIDGVKGFLERPIKDE